MTETTESPPTKPAGAPRLTIDQQYAYLMKAIMRVGQQAQIKVGAHIRSVTNNKYNSVAIYHADKNISDEDKHQLYKLLFNVLTAKGPTDWSRLQGYVHRGAARAEEEAPPGRIDPLDEVPVPRAVKPAEPEVAEVSADASADPLTALIIKLVSKHIKVASGTDEKRVEEIARGIMSEAVTDFDDQFKGKLEKAMSNGSFPLERVQELVDKAKAELTESLSAGMVKRIEFVNAVGEVKPVNGLVHPQVPQVAAWIRAGVPVWAWSAAGSGKTHMARQIAAMLEVEPYIVSVDPTLTVSKLMGYRNVANGDFVPGFAYKPYSEGGLFALDEIDTGDPGVIASANALLSNNHYLFPNNETLTKHAKFGVLAMGNTKGMGAVAGYTARNRLDAATLDRFAIVEFKYDNGLEAALACGNGVPGKLWEHGEPATPQIQNAYVEWVQKVRAYCKDSVLISPRASINGCKALRAGIPVKEVVDALVFKLVTEDTRTRIVDNCGKVWE